MDLVFLAAGGAFLALVAAALILRLTIVALGIIGIEIGINRL